MTDSAPQPVPAPTDPDSARPTGHPGVDAVTDSLRELDGLPVDQHVTVFESAHERLRAVLASDGAPAPNA